MAGGDCGITGVTLGLTAFGAAGDPAVNLGVNTIAFTFGVHSFASGFSACPGGAILGSSFFGVVSTAGC